MLPFIDAHCHLDLLKDIQKHLHKEDAQLIKTITVTNAPFLFTPNQRLFTDSRNIRVALGMHPELVAKYSNQLDRFIKQIDYTKYVGEIGLDGSRDFQNSFGLQKTTFEAILRICKHSNGKILTVHSRNAATETITLLDKHLNGSNCKVILHWFSGSISELEIGSQLGFYFSVNHKMTTSEKGKRIVAAIPKHLLLTETDAPFTFDQQIMNRLQSLKQTTKNIAMIKNVSEDEIISVIYNNFKTLLKAIE